MEAGLGEVSRLGSKSNVVFSLLLFLPSALLLYFISLLGVNVVIADEWELVPALKEWMNGALPISYFFSQQNEHRLVFDRVVMLIIESLSRFNTVYEMVWSWFLLSLTGLLVFRLYYAKSSRSTTALLAFAPASLLLFSFRQYESILFGFPSHIYMMIFGVVAAFVLLDKSNKIDRWFLLSVLAAILASFSFLTGLVVWPTGLIQILGSQRGGGLRRTASWAMCGSLATAIYFYHWSKPRGDVPFTYVFAHPVTSGAYFFTLIGAPFSFTTYMAIAFGVLLAVISVIVLIQSHRAGILRRNWFSISLILFAAGSSLVTTIGRVGYGVEQALVSSRYTPITSIGIIGLYLLALALSNSRSSKNRAFCYRVLLASLLIGLMVGYGAGWQAGREWSANQSVAAYVLKTYEIQSDQNIMRYLYPVPSIARDRAHFLEQNRLNVFNQEMANISELKQSSLETSYSLDTVDGVSASGALVFPINSTRQETITVTGWAVDDSARNVASAVFISVDGKTNIATLYGLERPDVATSFHDSLFTSSGFMATFSSSILSPGRHAISLVIVSNNGLSYYVTPEIVELVVV